MTKLILIGREIVWFVVGYAVVWLLMTSARLTIGMVRAAFSR